MLMDILTSSTFPETEFERERSLSQAALASLADDPTNALVLGYLELFTVTIPTNTRPMARLPG